MLQAETSSVEDLLDRRHLMPTYQPIFDLASGEAVGAEALARWPALDVTPDRALRWAAKEGRLAELDRACREAAIEDAIHHGLPEGFCLFVNLEPSVLAAGTAEQLVAQVGDRVRLVVEITERSILGRPAELLNVVRRLRSAGCAIALDDVGAQPDSLALLPFIAPDIVKLDLALVQRWPDIDRAAIVTAVAAYAERTGATVLAEGIETPEHLDEALALGATLGQGWHLERPGPLGVLFPPSRPLGPRLPLSPVPMSPFSLVGDGHTRVASKSMLMGLSRHLENQGLDLETPAVMLGAFQDARRFTGDTARRYSRLAGRCSLVAALGEGVPRTPVLGVRGASLTPDDPLCGEWVVTVVGAHYVGALIAMDLGDSGPDSRRRFAYTLTHDHDTVLGAARSMAERLTMAPGPVSRRSRPPGGRPGWPH